MQVKFSREPDLGEVQATGYCEGYTVPKFITDICQNECRQNDVSPRYGFSKHIESDFNRYSVLIDHKQTDKRKIPCERFMIAQYDAEGRCIDTIFHSEYTEDLLEAIINLDPSLIHLYYA
jgi:hypothetical protein